MSSVLSDKQISTGFELQSLVDSHQHPFVVIDRDSLSVASPTGKRIGANSCKNFYACRLRGYSVKLW